MSSRNSPGSESQERAAAAKGLPARTPEDVKRSNERQARLIEIARQSLNSLANPQARLRPVGPG